MAFDPVKVKQVLNSFGEKVVAKSKENLSPRSVSGNLASKIKFVATVMPNSMSLKFDLGEYGQGIDQGIKGSTSENQVTADTPFKFQSVIPSRAMQQNLDTWASRVGFVPFSKDRRFAIATLGAIILQRGIKPTHFFRDAYEEHFATLETEIIEAFGLDLDDFFEFIFKQ